MANIVIRRKGNYTHQRCKDLFDTPVAATIINGASDGPVVTFESDEPSSAILNGFTIQGGHASVASHKNGGGIAISNASPTITNNVVTNNIGCGVFIYNAASPIIQGNDVKQNKGPGTVGGSHCVVAPASSFSGRSIKSWYWCGHYRCRECTGNRECH
jgi:parallel beta-helix repeat protein